MVYGGKPSSHYGLTEDSYHDMLVETHRNFKAPRQAFQTFEALRSFVNTHQEPHPDMKYVMLGAYDHGVTNVPTACEIYMVSYTSPKYGSMRIGGEPAGWKMLPCHIEPLTELTKRRKSRTETDFHQDDVRPTLFSLWRKVSDRFSVMTRREDSDIRALGLVRNGMIGAASLFAHRQDALDYLEECQRIKDRKESS